MKSLNWKALTAIIAATVVFFAGFLSGKEIGYDSGFEEGATAAEDYAKQCYNNLDSEVRSKFGISACDAALAINKYDGTQDGDLLFNEYSDVVNAYYALEYFYNNLWDELCNVSEVAIDKE